MIAPLRTLLKLAQHVFAIPPIKRVEPDTIHPWSLSRPVLQLDDHECMRLRDFYTGIQIWGSTGSGKSSGPFRTLTKSILELGAGGMFLSVKPTDARDYVEWIRAAGREKDLLLLGPNHPHTSINFLSEISLGEAGVIANITSLISSLTRMVTGKADRGGGEGGHFWELQESQLIQRSAQTVTLAGEHLTVRNMERIIVSLPATRADVADAAWRNSSYCWHCLQAAWERNRGSEEVDRLGEFFLDTLARLSEKTKSTVVSSVLATLGIFQEPTVQRLISASSPTFEFSQLAAGKLLVVDYPALVHLEQSRLVQFVLQTCFMLRQNRRVAEPNMRPVLLAADESQQLIDVEGMGNFVAVARASCTSVILATQCISNYLSMNSSRIADAQTLAMQANLQNQFACQTSSVRLVEHIQSLLGRRRTYMMNSNTQRSGQDWVAQAMGIGNETGVSTGFGEQISNLIEADVLHDLARGGAEYDYMFESLVYMSGRSFESTGAPYMIARFHQR